MYAIGFDAYGGPDVLRPVVLPDPHPGPGEVRVRVAAAGVAPVDAMERTGRLAALTVDKIDGADVLGGDHPLAAALAEAGFRLTPKGLRLRR